MPLIDGVYNIPLCWNVNVFSLKCNYLKVLCKKITCGFKKLAVNAQWWVGLEIEVNLVIWTDLYLD